MKTKTLCYSKVIIIKLCISVCRWFHEKTRQQIPVAMQWRGDAPVQKCRDREANFVSFQLTSHFLPLLVTTGDRSHHGDAAATSTSKPSNETQATVSGTKNLTGSIFVLGSCTKLCCFTLFIPVSHPHILRNLSVYERSIANDK